MEQAMESPHALDWRNCRALVGKARFSYFIDVCNSCSCNTPVSDRYHTPRHARPSPHTIAHRLSVRFSSVSRGADAYVLRCVARAFHILLRV